MLPNLSALYAQLKLCWKKKIHFPNVLFSNAWKNPSYDMKTGMGILKCDNKLWNKKCLFSEFSLRLIPCFCKSAIGGVQSVDSVQCTVHIYSLQTVYSTGVQSGDSVQCTVQVDSLQTVYSTGVQSADSVQCTLQVYSLQTVYSVEYRCTVWRQRPVYSIGVKSAESVQCTV